MYLPKSKITFDVSGFTKKKPGNVAIVNTKKMKNYGMIEFIKLVIAPVINKTNKASIK